MNARSIILILTDRCNLDCEYCYAFKSNKDMSLETARESVDFLVKGSGNQEMLAVNFLGGEPLLKFDLIREVVLYCEKIGSASGKRISHSITTNGVLFTDEMIDFFKEKKITIFFSWDGDRERIIKVKGKPAYDRMAENIRKLNSNGMKIAAKVTVDPQDLRLVDFSRSLIQAGFHDYYFTMRTGTDKWDEENATAALMDYAKHFVDEFRSGRVVPDSTLKYQFIKRLSLISGGQAGCGAGVELFAISADGKILPCHHVETWQKRHEMGDVYTKKIDDGIRHAFCNIKRRYHPECATCVARETCNGGCIENNYDENGDMGLPGKSGCIWTRARHKSASYIFDELYVKDKCPHFIRWFMSTVNGWDDRTVEVKLTLDQLEAYGDEPIGNVSFRLKPDDLTLDTGNLIAGFLRHTKATPVKPLPHCIFGSRYEDMAQEFDFPRNLIGRSIENLSGEKENARYVKSITGMYDEYKKICCLPRRCRGCSIRLRDRCDFCYFGLSD